MTDNIQELERKISEEQTILARYEEMEQLEGDPRELLKLQKKIERTKILVLGYQTRLAELRTGLDPKPRMQTRQTSAFIANAPYGLESGLVGRKDELLLLDDWFHNDPAHPLLAVIGLGGAGKSALTWHWLQKLIQQKLAPPLVVWWSFYETDGTMDKLVAEVLQHFGDDPRHFPSLRAAVNRFITHLRRAPALVVLDGAERLLRAYHNLGAAYQGDEERRDDATDPFYAHARQCVDPVIGALLQWLAQPGLTQAHTLMTSRLFPEDVAGRSGGPLQGVRRHDLTGLNPDDAYLLFTGLGVRATRAEVVAVCEPLGYHPLSLRLLASYAVQDPKAPNDLRSAANYDPTDDLLGKRQHVLKQAYDSLPPRARHLLSRLAAFRGSVAWETIEAIIGSGKPVRDDLNLLQRRGLLQRTVRDGAAGYDLHPIVRRYAYGRLADPVATHAQLVVYFEAVPPPERVHSLADLAPAIELYHHLARAGKYDEARDLYYDRLNKPLYFQLGAYQQAIELLRALFPEGEDKPPRLSEEGDQAWTLNALVNSYSLSGQPAAAVPVFQQAADIAEKLGNKKNLAIGLGNLADDQMKIGALAAAADNLRRRIELCREIEDRFSEAIGHQEYGRLLAYCGDWAGAAAELDTALEQFTEEDQIQGQGVTWAYRALAALLQGDGAAGLAAAQEALRLADETSRTRYLVERDYVQAYWLLGWARLLLGKLDQAQDHLDEALRRYRAINLLSLNQLFCWRRRAWPALWGKKESCPTVMPRRRCKSLSAPATGWTWPTSTTSWSNWPSTRATNPWPAGMPKRPATTPGATARPTPTGSPWTRLSGC